jgi:hypothetical protein
MPPRASALTTLGGQSGLTGRRPSASLILATSFTSIFGRSPARTRGPSRETSSSSCRSACHGRPSAGISTAAGALADSAASSRSW